MRLRRFSSFLLLTIILMFGVGTGSAQAAFMTYFKFHKVDFTSCTPGYVLSFDFEFGIANGDTSSLVWSVTNLRTGVTTSPTTIILSYPTGKVFHFSNFSSGTGGSSVPAGTQAHDILRQTVHMTSTIKDSYATITFDCTTGQVIRESGSGSENTAIFTDGRINPEAQATMVGYCTDSHGIVVYSPTGVKLFAVTAAQIKDRLTTAVNTGNHALIAQAAGQQLWALKSNQLQFHNAFGEKYDYIFPGNYCS